MLLPVASTAINKRVPGPDIHWSIRLERQANMRHYDVVIIGGGPAGSTVSSLVKLYSPQLKILLLEKAHFPRHHVGESLLAGGTPVLSEMGVYEKVKQYGFVEKLGATYVWGRDRKPWGF